MSRSARYKGVFGAGIQTFQMTIAGLEELQEACDAGPEELLDRVITGRWRVADIREPLRLGLIGGGMAATEALLTVNRYAAPGNLVSHKSLVIGVLGAAIAGAPDEDVPPEKPKRRKAPASPAANSGSPPSTKSAGRSGSRRARSAKAPSGS